MRLTTLAPSLFSLVLTSCFTGAVDDPGGRFIQIEVVGEVVVDTGNPDVVAPRYRYRSLESFDVTGVVAVSSVVASAATQAGGSSGPGWTSPSAWPGEREAAIEHARADLLRRAGTCVQLVNPVASTAGTSFTARRSVITTSSDVELEESQVEGLCRGGAFP